MKRSFDPAVLEMMDRPQPVSTELERDLERLRRCRALSKRFVLATDLRRGFLLRAGVYMLTALIFREPMTRFDARLSARRAFSFAEMRELAIQAGWKNFGHKKFRFSRQAVWLK